MDPIALTKEQAAEYLGMKRQTLDHYLRSDPWYRDFPDPVPISSKATARKMYSRTDIDAFFWGLKQKRDNRDNSK